MLREPAFFLDLFHFLVDLEENEPQRLSHKGTTAWNLDLFRLKTTQPSDEFLVGSKFVL